METCSTCGNEYDKPFEVRYRGQTFFFDSLECAVHKLAPICTTCKCRIIGHGLEKDGTFYCCDSCAEKDGVTALRDRL